MTKLTPASEQKVAQLYALLCRCARHGDLCPTNDAIRLYFGSASTGTVVRWLDILRERGMIEVERGHNARRVTIVATGAQTAPMPKSTEQMAREKRADQPPPPAARTPKEIDPLPSREAEAALSAQERERLRLLAARIKYIGYATTCRAIVTVPASAPLDAATLKRARAGDMTIFCGERSEPGCSYCAKHRRGLFVRQRDKSDRMHEAMAVPADSVERAFYFRCRSQGLNHMQAIARVNTMREGLNCG